MKLRHFKEHEFIDAESINWYSLMSVKLLGCLDQLREVTGYRISINTVKGAIGRADGTSSQHDARSNSWDEVRAVDVTVCHTNGSPLSMNEASQFLETAKNCGFTGIGIYPKWRKPGFHLDVRWNRPAGKPSGWSDIGIGEHKYMSGWSEGLAQWPSVK